MKKSLYFAVTIVFVEIYHLHKLKVNWLRILIDNFLAYNRFWGDRALNNFLACKLWLRLNNKLDDR